MATIEIDDLPTTNNPKFLHFFPAMKDGLTVQLSVQQVYDLILAAMQVNAPANMNTFDEISASLGDDPAFAATMAAALTLKGAKSGDTFTGPTLVDPIMSGLIRSPQDRGFLFQPFNRIASNNATDATNDLDFYPHICSSMNSDGMMELTTMLTKRLDANWTVGNNNGALDQGTVGSKTYHWHTIERDDTHVVDILASLSHGDRGTATITIATPAVVTWNDHGLVAGSTVKFATTGALPTGITAGTLYYVQATGLTQNAFRLSTTNGGSDINTSGSQSGVHTAIGEPQLPANYSRYRRIMSLPREAGINIPFHNEGNIFSRANAFVIVNSLTAYSNVLRSCGTPVGIPVRPIVLAQAGVSAVSSNTSLALGSANIGGDGASQYTVAVAATGSVGDGALVNSLVTPVMTQNNLGQLYTTLSKAGTTSAATLWGMGWVDTRGKT